MPTYYFKTDTEFAIEGIDRADARRGLLHFIRLLDHIEYPLTTGIKIHSVAENED